MIATPQDRKLIFPCHVGYFTTVRFRLWKPSANPPQPTPLSCFSFQKTSVRPSARHPNQRPSLWRAAGEWLVGTPTLQSILYSRNWLDSIQNFRKHRVNGRQGESCLVSMGWGYTSQPQLSAINLFAFCWRVCGNYSTDSSCIHSASINICVKFITLGKFSVNICIWCQPATQMGLLKTFTSTIFSETNQRFTSTDSDHKVQEIKLLNYDRWF